MTKLAWDAVGERVYETGVDHGVLYIPDETGDYNDGVAWNGLVTVTEKPSGASANAQYADNQKYLNLYSKEEFGATIEAFTYPPEFYPFDGMAVPVPGITVGQQGRRAFGLSYRTLIGNDLDGNDHGFKLHLVYGATASPSEKAYGTVNDSPSPISFSWDVETLPVAVVGADPTDYTDLKSTSILTLSSVELDATVMGNLMDILYGTDAVDPRLPLPGEVLDLFSGTVTTVTATAPTIVDNTITIPTVVGVTYYIDGSAVTGDVDITEDTLVTARPNAHYIFAADSDDDWRFDYTP